MKSFVVGKIFLIVFIGLVQTFMLKALKILVIFFVKPAKYGSTINSFSSNERKELVVLPYLAGFTEKITRIFKAFNIKVCTTPIKTIKNILPTTINQRTGAIYQIPCKNCSVIYIGETSRSFKTRCSKHERDLNPRNLAKIDDNNINKKTALVKHVVNFKHSIDFDNSSILAFESDFFKRRFLESFFINNKITTVNDKENCFL